MKNENVKVSIIVPVYNAVAYLDRCLESIINQTYRNLEIILVDDGSTDGSEKKCVYYQKKDSRIILLHSKNGGAARARNLGIANSNGQYISFVDADDYIVSDYIEGMIDIILNYKLDIVVCGYVKFFEGKSAVSSSEKLKVDHVNIVTGEKALEMMLYRKTFTSSPWAKLIKSSIVKEFLFPDGKLFEDLGTVYKWFASAEQIGYISKKGYYYLQRPGSCQNSEYNPRKWDLIEFSEDIMKYITNNKPNIIKSAYNRLFISSIQILRQIPYNEQNRKDIEELQYIIKKYRSCVMVDSKAKPTSRLLAFISYLNIDVIRYLGQGYDYLGTKLKIKARY